MSKATLDEVNKDYSSAIAFYNGAYLYYKFNHYSEENESNYLAIPYKIAICYLNEGQKEKSAKSMLNGMVSTQKEFGLYSKQTATFIKKYLIPYYLDNNYNALAQNEFGILLTIYKKIGYNNNQLANTIRLRGDLYYQRKDYIKAMFSYEKAYNLISKQTFIDYEILSEIVQRMGDYDIQNGKFDDAINLYNETIKKITPTDTFKKNFMAEMLINLGDTYFKQGNTKKATESYENAIEIIEKLPRTNSLRQHIVIYLTKLKSLYDSENSYAKSRDMEMRILRAKRFSFI